MLIIRKAASPIDRKLPKPKTEPIILGVLHSPECEERELQWVADQMAKRKPGKSAIELPTDFREKEGTTTFFFGKLVPVCEVFDSEVIPIDHPLLIERARIVSKAIDILEQGYTEEDITKDVMRIAQTAFYGPPESSDSDMARARVLAHAYLLIRLGNGMESLMKTWAGLMRRREALMTKKIIKERPQMVIVGDAHAMALHGQLEDYSYLKSPYVPKDGRIRMFSI